MAPSVLLKIAMKWTLVGIAVVALGLPPLAAGQRNVKAPVNVNSRYTVESVELEGMSRDTLSQGLRKELDQLVGRRFDQDLVNQFIERLRSEVRVLSVEQRLARGSEPNSVRIVVEVHRRRNDIDVATTKLAYHGGEGWTGALDSTIIFGDQKLGAGIQSDGDTLAERLAGVNAHYEWRPLANAWVRVRFDYEAFHEQWNGATRSELESRPDLPGLYSSRRNAQPAVLVDLAPGLSLSAGMSFENIDFDLPAARGQSANGVVTTLRYHRRWNDAIGPDRDELEAGYTLRAATHILSSDLVYSRNAASLAYRLFRRHHRLDLQARAGSLSGRAPLYERFVLGNSQVLRGWNKYELAPLGGERYEYASAQYSYRLLEAFYDTGAVWNHGAGVTQRHSAGVGIGWDEFLIAVGFPLRSGRCDPIFFMAVKF